ncbi:MAG: phosphotransferase [Chitinivibrionales bacterium]|nr:phosphotransferase [Chitinivibrionales bacterium]
MSDAFAGGHLDEVLSQWGITAPYGVDPMGEHRDVRRITTDSGEYVVKDITHSPGLPRLAFDCAIVEHLAAGRIPVVRPAKTRTGQYSVKQGGRVFLLLPFVRCEPAGDRASRAEILRYTGQVIADVHAVLATYPMDNLLEHTWREDLAVDSVRWAESLLTRLPDHLGRILREVWDSRREEAVNALRGLPEQLIHRDCHAGNFLVDGTRVVGLIDCDHFSVGPRMFDLAYYAGSSLKRITEDPAATTEWRHDLRSLVNGYREHGELSARECAAMPFGIMADHLMLAHWFAEQGRVESTELDVKALLWLHRNLEAVKAAVMS